MLLELDRDIRLSRVVAAPPLLLSTDRPFAVRCGVVLPAPVSFPALRYCAVSGSPVSPRDATRYRMRLDRVDGSGREEGFMYYCCWPCVCDTQDFIKVDTKTVQTADGDVKLSVAVLGNPCDHPEELAKPFIQPFDRRSTTILETAREVRCGPGGELVGATLSDHGYVIISVFFNATDEASAGLRSQDEVYFADHCEDRKQHGYNSGMGEIFRRVAAISPIKITPQLEAGTAEHDRECAARGLDREECAAELERGKVQL